MPSFSRTQEFDSIYVVQFLGANDSKTGTTLYAETIEPLAQNAGVRSALLDARSRAGLFEALDLIATESAEGRHAPIVHLETHGSIRGIGANDSEIVTWSDLKPKLIAINDISQLNLFVTVAACHGLQLLQTLSPIDRAPVWGFLGPDALT